MEHNSDTIIITHLSSAHDSDDIVGIATYVDPTSGALVLTNEAVLFIIKNSGDCLF